MFYRVQQVLDYIFKKAKEEDIREVKGVLNPLEFEIFQKMDEYDKYHCLKVYKKMKQDKLLKDDTLYLKLGILHDCGKSNIGLVRRIKKVIIEDEVLNKHPKLGYDKLKDINLELAKLVLVHHSNKGENIKITRFQEIDDIS